MRDLFGAYIEAATNGLDTLPGLAVACEIVRAADY